MNLFNRENYDQISIIRILCLVDFIQPAIMILSRACAIIFHPITDEESTVFQQNQSSTVVVVLFAFVICVYVIHMTIALKLLSALKLMEIDPLMAARNAKVWQNWSILVLLFLVGNLFASILSASTKLAVAFATIFGICEIIWRLFGIYNVGKFIDELVSRIPYPILIIPTLQFFGVRFPVPANPSSEQI